MFECPEFKLDFFVIYFDATVLPSYGWDESASVNKNELFIGSESPLHGAYFYLGHIAVSLQTKKVSNFKKYLKTTFYHYFKIFSRPLLTTYFWCLRPFNIWGHNFWHKQWTSKGKLHLYLLLITGRIRFQFSTIIINYTHTAFLYVHNC